MSVIVVYHGYKINKIDFVERNVFEENYLLNGEVKSVFSLDLLKFLLFQDTIESYVF